MTHLDDAALDAIEQRAEGCIRSVSPWQDRTATAGLAGQAREQAEAALTLLAAVREARAAATDAEQRAQAAQQILDDLIDPDDCWYDHHGYCQAHGWTDTDPACPHRRAKELRRALGDDQQEAT